jgi:hypothetical protein
MQTIPSHYLRSLAWLVPENGDNAMGCNNTNQHNILWYSTRKKADTVPMPAAVIAVAHENYSNAPPSRVISGACARVLLAIGCRRRRRWERHELAVIFPERGLEVNLKTFAYDHTRARSHSSQRLDLFGVVLVLGPLDTEDGPGVGSLARRSSRSRLAIIDS